MSTLPVHRKKGPKAEGQKYPSRYVQVLYVPPAFTVKVGTGFEFSHLELHLWFQAIYLVSSAKRRVTIRELQQTLGIARKTAWILNQRVRELITSGE